MGISARKLAMVATAVAAFLVSASAASADVSLYVGPDPADPAKTLIRDDSTGPRAGLPINIERNSGNLVLTTGRIGDFTVGGACTAATAPAPATPLDAFVGSPTTLTTFTCPANTSLVVELGEGNDILRSYGPYYSTETVPLSNSAISVNAGEGDDALDLDAKDIRVSLGPGNDVGHFGHYTDNRQAVSTYVEGGDGNDDFIVSNVQNAIADAGPGDDRIVASGRFTARVNGREGNDNLQGGVTFNPGDRYGTSVVAGDAGNDQLQGFFAADTILGGTGDDTIKSSIGYDIFDGGPGTDTVDYGTGPPLPRSDRNYVSPTAVRTFLLGISLGQIRGTRVITNTGYVQYNEVGVDNLARGIENVAGGYFGDVITGSSGVNRLDGSYGNDLIRSRDRSADTVICGPNRDQVEADRSDHIDASCETVSYTKTFSTGEATKKKLKKKRKKKL